MRLIRIKVGSWLMGVAFRLAPGHKVYLPLYRLGARLHSA